MIEQVVPEELSELATVQEGHETDLLDKQNVVGVALGHKVKGEEETDEPCLSVLVAHKVDKSMLSKNDRVPGSIEKHKTDVVEVGELFAGGGAPMLDEAADTDPAPGGDVIQLGSGSLLRRRMRPAEGGFSVGNSRSNSAGTLGTCCYDRGSFPGIPRRYYILSNNHVLALSNDGRPGDLIVQPGRLDGGRVPGDVIARLSRFVPIRFHSGTFRPCNYADAAIAEGDLQDLDREIYWTGIARGRTNAQVGMLVQKTGRTTGYTTGRVSQINATVDVNYGSGRVGRFCRQIVTTNISSPGDSGSLVLDLEERAVGLLFAGSSTRTIVNPISFVESLLDIRVSET